MEMTYIAFLESLGSQAPLLFGLAGLLAGNLLGLVLVTHT